MTGYKSRYMRHDCGRDGCYYEKLPDWDDLIECFPGAIRPTDIDGMVEINNRFLFLEQKGCGVGIDGGQYRALKRLAAQPNVTVLIFRPALSRPTTDPTVDVECLLFENGSTKGWKPHSREWLKDWLAEWSANAAGSSSDPPLGETA